MNSYLYHHQQGGPSKIKAIIETYDQLPCSNVVSFLRAIFGEITWTLENWKCFIDPWIFGQLTI